MEYSATKKPTASMFAKRTACFFTAPVLVLLVIVVPVTLRLRITMIMMFLLPLVIVGGILLTIYLLRFTKVDYEYTIYGGLMSFAAIYDNKSRKEILSVKIAEMPVISPVGWSGRDGFDSPDIVKKYDFSSSGDFPDRYFFTYFHPKQGKIRVIFNATEKMVGILRFYNAQNTVVKTGFSK